MSTVEELREAWRRIEAWLGANVPVLFAELNAPAAPDEIAAAESAIGVAFPAEFRASLAVHDGQRLADATFGQWEPFDLRRVVERWRSLAERVATGTFPDHDEPHIQTRGPVRPRWWSRAWIPIAADGTGDLLAIDLEPPPGGDLGQVILFQHDTPYREVVASSFGAWLQQIAALLESGAYVSTPAGYALQPKA